MRYTTIIDISEHRQLYRSTSVRMVYLHMVLKSGYHDNDRDLVHMSIRSLAEEVGLTISATRHALKVLERATLITHSGSVFRVRKWIPEQQITARPKTLKQQERLAEAARRQCADEERERQLEIERLKREQAFAQGKNQFMIYYEDLQRKADAGDTEAQEAVRRQRKNYEYSVQQMELNKINNQAH